MPRSTVLDLAEEEHAQLLAALRRARYGYLLALHILLLCAATRTPTEIAAVLFCSRSSVYRTMRAYRAGTLGLESDAQGRLAASHASVWVAGAGDWWFDASNDDRMDVLPDDDARRRSVEVAVHKAFFEGTEEVLIGVRGGERPFRAFALTDPGRIVIDVPSSG